MGKEPEDTAYAEDEQCSVKPMFQLERYVVLYCHIKYVNVSCGHMFESCCGTPKWLRMHTWRQTASLNPNSTKPSPVFLNLSTLVSSPEQLNVIMHLKSLSQASHMVST